MLFSLSLAAVSGTALMKYDSLSKKKKPLGNLRLPKQDPVFPVFPEQKQVTVGLPGPPGEKLPRGVFVRCKGEDKLFALHDSICCCTETPSNRRIGVSWLFTDRSDHLNMYGSHISITVGRGTSHVNVDVLTAQR